MDRMGKDASRAVKNEDILETPMFSQKKSPICPITSLSFKGQNVVAVLQLLFRTTLEKTLTLYYLNLESMKCWKSTQVWAILFKGIIQNIQFCLNLILGVIMQSGKNHLSLLQSLKEKSQNHLRDV